MSKIRHLIFGRPFAKRFGLCYRTVVCPVLSCPVCDVTLVYCGQTVGRIKMKLDMQVGIGPRHTVLDGDPAPIPKEGSAPLIFGPCILWPNSCMVQDATWHESRPRFRPPCARWGPGSPPRTVETAPNFRPMLLWPNGWMYQDATWYDGIGLGPGNIVLDAHPAPPPKGHSPKFRPMSVVAKRLHGSRFALGTEVGLGQGYIVLHGDSAPPQKSDTVL